MAATAGLVLCLVAAGCGHGESAAAPTTSGTQQASSHVAAVAADGFCNRLADLDSATRQIGLDHLLTDIRRDVAESAKEAASVRSGGVPAGSGVQPVLSNLATSLQEISTWVGAEAKQSDLDSDRVPAGVKKAMSDMGYDFRQLQQWTNANCKDQPQSDGH